MGAKYAELAEFERSTREDLESRGIDFNLMASVLVLFRLGISANAYANLHTDQMKQYVYLTIFDLFIQCVFH